MSLPQTIEEFVEKWVAWWEPDKRRELKRDIEWLIQLHGSVELGDAICGPDMTPEERRQRAIDNPQPAEIRVNPDARYTGEYFRNKTLADADEIRGDKSG